MMSTEKEFAVREGVKKLLMIRADSLILEGKYPRGNISSLMLKETHFKVRFFFLFKAETLVYTSHNRPLSFRRNRF